MIVVYRDLVGVACYSDKYLRLILQKEKVEKNWWEGDDGEKNVYLLFLVGHWDGFGLNIRAWLWVETPRPKPKTEFGSSPPLSRFGWVLSELYWGLGGSQALGFYPYKE